MIHLVSIDEAAELLQQGKVGVVPTDTVYGVVALAANSSAVGSLYALKHRTQKPGSLIAASTQQLLELGFEATELKRVADHFTAGTSVIVAHSLTYLHQGLGDQAVRIVDSEPVVRLLRQAGPLQTSSANTPGMPPANTVQEAYNYFGEQVDFYVDGGNLQGREASRIIRVLSDGEVDAIR